MVWDPICKWIHRRPLMLFAACLTIGMVIGYQNAVSWYVWASGLAVCTAIGLLRKRTVFVFSSAMMLGALLVTLALIKPVVQEQDDVFLTGRLASEPDVREEYTRFLLTDVSADGQPLPTRVMVYLHDADLPPLEYGMTVAFTADLYLPEDPANPYSDTYEAYLWRQGAALCASSWESGLTVTAPPSLSLTGASIRCRSYLQSVVESIYSDEIAPLVSSLVLGDRSMLPDELYSNFKVVGLAHLLAISGLHISCLAAALDYILRKLRCPGRLTFVLVTLFLILYSAVIGFPPSINRALLMYMLSAGARLFGRPSDSLTGLSLALLVLLLINPLNIADVSLILSFASVAGIIILSPLLKPKCLSRLRGPLHSASCWTLSALAASLAAQLGALPTVACVFGALSTYALLSNLPALPLMTLSLPVAMLSVGLGCLAPQIGRVLAWPVEYALQMLVLLTNRIAALPGAVVNTPQWPIWLLLLYASIFVLLSPVSNIRRRFKQLLLGLLPVCAASVLLLPLTFPTTGLEVTFLDAGQADAALVRAEDQYYLVDVGEDSVMADHLLKSGVRPTAIFLTHPHSDHAGGLEEILELCDPSTVYVPCLWNAVPADEGIPEVLEKARIAGWRIQPLQAGDTLSLSGHVTARIHQPFPSMTDDANGASLVMSIHLGDSSVLFTGDLPIEAEHVLFPDCDLLKVAHHGAKSSTSRLFLEMTSPSAAVISVGHNAYGHPSPETLARLEGAGAAVYRTDECGAVTALLGTDGILKITPMTTKSESEAAS